MKIKVRQHHMSCKPNLRLVFVLTKQCWQLLDILSLSFGHRFSLLTPKALPSNVTDGDCYGGVECHRLYCDRGDVLDWMLELTFGFWEYGCLPRPDSLSVPGEKHMTGKSHKTSFRGHTEIACLFSATSHHPPPTPVRLHSYIRWTRWRHASREWVHLQAIPLRGVKLPPFGWTVSGQGALLPR